MVLDLALNKSLYPNNCRLLRIYRVLVLITASLLATYSYQKEVWSCSLKWSDRHSFSVQIPRQLVRSAADNTFGSMQAVGSAEAHPACTGNAFAYKWDEEGRYVYTNFTCRGLCHKGALISTCMTQAEVIQVNDEGNSIFFVTYGEEALISGSNGTFDQRTSQFFVPLENAYAFNLAYTYSLPGIPARADSTLWKVSDFTGGSSTNTLTFLLDSNGVVQRSVQPNPQGINIGLIELLELAGTPYILNNPQPSLGRNLLPDASIPSGPVGRLSGLQLELVLMCFNRAAIPRNLDVGGWRGPVCTARVLSSQPRWNFRFRTDILLSQSRQAQYSGVYVRVRGHGAIKVFDLPGLLSFLVQACVVMTLPSIVCRFIALHCLGHLSTIYRSALNSQLNFSRLVSTFALDILSSVLMVQQVEEGSPKVLMKQALVLLEQDKNLKAADGSICVRQNSKDAFFCRFAEKPELPLDVERGHKQASTNSEIIDLKPSVATICAESYTGIQDVLKLIDPHRQVGLLERFFLPASDCHVKLQDIASELSELDTVMHLDKKGGDSTCKHDMSTASTSNDEQGGRSSIQNDTPELQKMSACVRPSQQHKPDPACPQKPAQVLPLSHENCGRSDKQDDPKTSFLSLNSMQIDREQTLFPNKMDQARDALHQAQTPPKNYFAEATTIDLQKFKRLHERLLKVEKQCDEQRVLSEKICMKRIVEVIDEKISALSTPKTYQNDDMQRPIVNLPRSGFQDSRREGSQEMMNLCASHWITDEGSPTWVDPCTPNQIPDESSPGRMQICTSDQIPESRPPNLLNLYANFSVPEEGSPIMPCARSTDQKITDNSSWKKDSKKQQNNQSLVSSQPQHGHFPTGAGKQSETSQVHASINKVARDVFSTRWQATLRMDDLEHRIDDLEKLTGSCTREPESVNKSCEGSSSDTSSTTTQESPKASPLAETLQIGSRCLQPQVHKVTYANLRGHVPPRPAGDETDASTVHEEDIRDQQASFFSHLNFWSSSPA